MPGPDLSIEKKTEIKTLLHLKKLSIRQISRITGISKSTVARLKSSTSFSSRRQGKCGRKKSTTPKQERLLLRNLRRAPLSDAHQLHSELKQDGVSVSLRTVQRRLRKHCRSMIPRRVPKLTPVMMRKRLALPKNMLIGRWNNGDVCASAMKVFSNVRALKRGVFGTSKELPFQSNKL